MIQIQDRVSKARPVGMASRVVAPCMAAHAPLLRRYFSRRAPAADVDDLVQDVFVRLQSAQPRAPVIDVEAYLVTIARHVLVSRRRWLTRRCSALHDAIDDAPELASDLSPERILGARQDYARAMAAVSDLPPRARAAFQLHRFEQMSYAGIAERMGISRESVKELLHRAAVRVGQIRENLLNDIPPNAEIERL
jgi:RNA polymerase sigma factor (sigma-70 family)